MSSISSPAFKEMRAAYKDTIRLHSYNTEGITKDQVDKAFEALEVISDLQSSIVCRDIQVFLAGKLAIGMVDKTQLNQSL